METRDAILSSYDHGKLRTANALIKNMIVAAPLETPVLWLHIRTTPMMAASLSFLREQEGLKVVHEFRTWKQIAKSIAGMNGETLLINNFVCSPEVDSAMREIYDGKLTVHEGPKMPPNEVFKWEGKINIITIGLDSLSHGVAGRALEVSI